MSAVNRGVGAPGSAAELAEIERAMRHVEEWLPGHDQELEPHLDHAVLFTYSRSGKMTFSLTHSDALVVIRAIDGSGEAAGHLSRVLTERKPFDLPVVVILTDGSIFFRMLAWAAGSA